MSRWVVLDQSIVSNKQGIGEGLTPVLAQVLSNRGIVNSSAVKRFLSPSYNYVPNPYNFSNWQDVVYAIETSIRHNEKICIVGDYDLDGMAATAILWEYLYKMRHANIFPFIPSREVGYGLTEETVQEVVKQGAKLIITVDSGIRDVDIIEKWKNRGVKFVITDHHILPNILPKVPTFHCKLSLDRRLKDISGAAVAWYLVWLLNEAHGARLQPDEVTGIDLVGLTVLSDVLNAINEINRAFLFGTIKSLKTSLREGFKALFERLKINLDDLDEEKLSFYVIPVLNAAGRIGDPLDAVRLMVTQQTHTGAKYASKLQDVNDRRRQLTEEVTKEAESYISSTQTNKSKLYYAVGEDWSEGVIGLAASKLQKKLQSAAAIMTKRNGNIVGSIRGINGINVVELLEQVKEYLLRYGGHELAAGFTVKPDKLEEFTQELQKYANKTQKSHNASEHLIDLQLGVDDLTWNTYLSLMQLRPFGHKNKEPEILLSNVPVASARVVGDKHYKLILGGKYNSIDAILFNYSNIIDYSTLSKASYVSVIGNLRVNKWNGRESLQFVILDINV